MEPGDWLPFLAEIADAADAIALRYFGARDLRVEQKPDRTPVSEADLAIEEEARRLAAQRHPELGIFGEEQGETGDAGSRLVIDPIDATRNFVRGIPVFATLLAVEVDGEIAAGLVSAPALGTRWTAARGSGSWRGSHRLRVSSIGELSRAQLFHGSLGGAEGTDRTPGILELAAATQRQRGFGDFYQHCLVAEGAGEIAFDPITEPWDAAALVVLVEEAGGRATSLAGERTIYGRSLVSTNGLLHDTALRALGGKPTR